ncbi:tail fiber domain-containing protein [Citrobacter amalonaticus]|uniref:tail fiber domain-containing protein n=1 Tax=Citrobacter amalonaticus TaxID=35703 RepID=UPI0021B0BE06|nr:tail fiber domain-containing protein [Citrobacter amalonaticus]
MRSMRGYSWYYEPYGTQGFGFMADEAEKHFPGAVKTTEDFEVEMPDGSKIDDVKSVDTYGIAAALHHEAILVMMDQIAELKAEIKKLKGE